VTSGPRKPGVGVPALQGKEKTALFRHERIARRKTIFLPGAVMASPVGTIPMILASAIVRTGRRKSVALQFSQTSANAHKRIGKELAPLIDAGRIERFGMLVGSSSPFGQVLDRSPSEEDRGLGPIRIAFWLRVEGRKRAVMLPAVRARLIGQDVDTSLRPQRIPAASLFGPVSFWPEEWCLNPLCHAHWYFWPGVPPSTSCHGWCPVGRCRCPVLGTMPPGWAGTCAGLLPCVCR
jgi:hypothetical protein